ncbi:MAG: hypothetical protein JXX29_05595 [Deltaproteobacteria bacterium]|nr:hypothetical protein [Deltaproteobacteria bacterium]MBN2671123.1 hypothetical protein [Deltaproteobacteria bacterium]
MTNNCYNHRMGSVRQKLVFTSLFIAATWCVSTGCTEDLVIDDLGAQMDSETSQNAQGDTSEASLCMPASSDDIAASPVVDVIIAVDNSAGMDDEVLMVQNALADFYSRLAASGVDGQITLITAPSPSDDDKVKNGICVGTPLGSGECPDDSSLPAYFHVLQAIASKDALTLIHSTFEQWKSRIRENSQIHLMVISDDNADVTADEFVALMNALTPPLENFFFHTVSASADKTAACEADPPSPCCDYAAKAGVEYQNLAGRTGGVSADLCQQDFSTAFNNIADGVISLRCESVMNVEIVPL